MSHFLYHDGYAEDWRFVRGWYREHPELSTRTKIGDCNGHHHR